MCNSCPEDREDPVTPYEMAVHAIEIMQKAIFAVGGYDITDVEVQWLMYNQREVIVGAIRKGPGGDGVSDSS
jgi:hypothetical protein